MPIDFDVTNASPPVLEMICQGKLEREDYEKFIPALNTMLKEHGSIRLLVRLLDFEGWTAGALWEDVKMDLKHFNDIDRLAIVGESTWEKGLSVFSRPFTSAQVKFFDDADLQSARRWLKESPQPSASASCSPRL